MNMAGVVVTMSVTVIMSMPVTMVMLMEEGSADDVEPKTDTSYYEH